MNTLRATTSRYILKELGYAERYVDIGDKDHARESIRRARDILLQIVVADAEAEPLSGDRISTALAEMRRLNATPIEAEEVG